MKVAHVLGENIYSIKPSRHRKYYDAAAEHRPWRDYLFVVLIFFALGLLFVKLLATQIFQGSYYRGLADSNRLRTQIIHAPRGIIFDRFGNPLVFNTPGYREIINGKVVFLNKQQALPLLAAGAKNIQIDSLRNYPLAAAAAHVLGYTGQISAAQLGEPQYSGYQPDSVVGESGIEQEYESELKGTDGKILMEVDAFGNVVKELGQTDPIPGQNITLTLDKGLQQAAYEAMKTQTRGAIIVSTPQGQILAMVSQPSYDPNLFTLGKSYRPASTSAYRNVASILLDGQNQPLLNRAITGTYPPGSTFKIVTAAAGLQQNIINDSWTIIDPGILHVGAFSFANWLYTDYGRKEVGPVDVVRAIARSNDIFFYELANKIGIDKLSKYAAYFGIGHRLGIDLPGEADGILPTVEWKEKNVGQPWYTGDTYEYGIGQGFLLTTPLQVNAWTDVVADGGTLYRPTLLLNQKPQVLHAGLLNKTNHDLIQKGMVEACSPGGVAYPLYNFIVQNKKLPIDGLDVTVPTASEAARQVIASDREVTLACKTGTAQVGGPMTPPDAWITVIAPAYHPQIVVTVLVENGGEGSTVAAPLAKQILDYWFTHEANDQ